MSTIRMEVKENGELVKIELPRIRTGALGLGKLKNISQVQDEDICKKDEFLITVDVSNSNDNFSFIVDKETTEYLLNTSIGAFIYICKAKGLSVKQEFQKLYPVLVY